MMTTTVMKKTQKLMKNDQTLYSTATNIDKHCIMLAGSWEFLTLPLKSLPLYLAYSVKSQSK